MKFIFFLVLLLFVSISGSVVYLSCGAKVYSNALEIIDTGVNIREAKHIGYLAQKSDANSPPNILDTTFPEKIMNLTVRLVSNSQLTLEWTKVKDQDLDHYNIYGGTTPNFALIPGVTVPLGKSISNLFSTSGLSPSTKYYFRVAAVDKSGNIGSLSSEQAGSTTNSSDSIPPAQATGLSVTTVSSHSLDLNWNPNAEYDLDHYNIYGGTTPNFALIPGVTVPLGKSISNLFSTSGLSPSTKYYFRVAAVDKSGNIGSLSSEKAGLTSYLPSHVINVDASRELDSEFPVTVQPVSSLLGRSSTVVDGFIIAKNSNFTDLNLSPWGTQNNMTLQTTTISNNFGKFYTLTGTTGNLPAGFLSNELEYNGRYISLFVGRAIKSADFQISISMDVQGVKSNYHLIFVEGHLTIAGWRGLNYYESISANSSKLIDLNELISSANDKYVSLKRITIVVQRDAMINPFEFRIDLGETTANPPTHLQGGRIFYVKGNVINDEPILKNSRYLINNFVMKRIVNLDFILKPNDYKIINNGWEIVSQKKLKSSGGETLSLVAEKPVPQEEFTPQAILQVDGALSLINMGHKDILFLTMTITGSFLLLLHRRRVDLNNR